MVCKDASKRLSLEQIKEHPWYNGKVYSPKEVAGIMAPILVKDNSDAQTSTSTAWEAYYQSIILIKLKSKKEGW